MKPEIKRAFAQREVYTAERCYITEVANDEGDELLSIALARVEPRVTTAWHKVEDTHERYLIIAGVGEVELADHDPVVVQQGDVVRIPSGTRQRITNTGEVDLLFYAVCTPPFRAANYTHLE